MWWLQPLQQLPIKYGLSLCEDQEILHACLFMVVTLVLKEESAGLL